MVARNFFRISRMGVWFLVCLVLLTIVSANARQSRPPSPVQARTAPLFEFHSNFWVNLHQALLRDALLHLERSSHWLQTGVPMPMTHVSKPDLEEWNKTVLFYASHFGSRDELFDEPLIRINNDLAKQPDDGLQLSPTGWPPDLVSVLRAVAPIYREYWWPMQNRSNERWISAQRARVQTLGPKLAAALTKDLHAAWPAAPIRVDVAYYVPEIGNAYTTVDPAHTTISSSAASLQGLSGFNVLFHEASHSFAGTELNAIAAECRKEHKRCGQLWHTLLFYTTGVELRRVLPPEEQDSFIPYAYRYGLYKRGWHNYFLALQAGWQPYLDHKISFDGAITRMVSTLPDRKGGP